MRTAKLVLGLALVALVTTNAYECEPGGSSNPTCGGEPCKREVHLNSQCSPVDAAGNEIDRVRVNRKNAVCIYNDASCTMRLTIPEGLFGVAEVTIKGGECVRLTVLNHAARKTYPYTIACDCPEASGRGHGNPEFKVGGGSGGGDGG